MQSDSAAGPDLAGAVAAEGEHRVRGVAEQRDPAVRPAVDGVAVVHDELEDLCPRGRKPPERAVRRTARPYKSAMERIML